MTTPDPQALARAQELLKQLWERHKDTIFERLELLENVSASALTMEDSAREDARSAAHKLAGALGTFGYKQGTEWARNSELIFSNPNLGPAEQQQLIENARSIRKLLESSQED